jgi:hypothetical protein
VPATRRAGGPDSRSPTTALGTAGPVRCPEQRQPAEWPPRRRRRHLPGAKAARPAPERAPAARGRRSHDDADASGTHARDTGRYADGPVAHPGAHAGQDARAPQVWQPQTREAPHQARSGGSAAKGHRPGGAVPRSRCGAPNGARSTASWRACSSYACAGTARPAARAPRREGSGGGTP